MGSWGGQIASIANCEVAVISDLPANNFANGECNAIWVGGAGDVAVVMANGTPFTFAGVQDGTLILIRAIRVNLTNTTATDILALYTRT